MQLRKKARRVRCRRRRRDRRAGDAILPRLAGLESRTVRLLVGEFADPEADGLSGHSGPSFPATLIPHGGKWPSLPGVARQPSARATLIAYNLGQRRAALAPISCGSIGRTGRPRKLYSARSWSVAAACP